MLELSEYLKLLKEEDAPGLGAPPPAAGGAAPPDMGGAAGGAAPPPPMPSAGGGAPPPDMGGGATPVGGGQVSGDTKTAPLNFETGFDALDYYFKNQKKSKD